MRPATRFRNFQIINIYVYNYFFYIQIINIYVYSRRLCVRLETRNSYLVCSQVFKSARLSSEQVSLNERRDDVWKLFAYNSRYLSQEIRCKAVSNKV